MCIDIHKSRSHCLSVLLWTDDSKTKQNKETNQRSTPPGASWKARRRLLTPAFHFQILNTFFDVFNEQSWHLVDQLSQQARRQPGQPLDIAPVVTNAALRIICGQLDSVLDSEKKQKQNRNQRDSSRSVPRTETSMGRQTRDSKEMEVYVRALHRFVHLRHAVAILFLFEIGQKRESSGAHHLPLKRWRTAVSRSAGSSVPLSRWPKSRRVQQQQQQQQQKKKRNEKRAKKKGYPSEIISAEISATDLTFSLRVALKMALASDCEKKRVREVRSRSSSRGYVLPRFRWSRSRNARSIWHHLGDQSEERE